MEQKFIEWVASLSKKYRQSQIKAAVRVNSEMLAFYFRMGEEISSTQFKSTYGSHFFETLSKELVKKLPDAKGLSPKNLRYMEKFYTLYKDKIQFFPQLVGQLFSIPWNHHRYIIDKNNFHILNIELEKLILHYILDKLHFVQLI